jgi:hypothetical protein
MGCFREALSSEAAALAARGEGPEERTELGRTDLHLCEIVALGITIALGVGATVQALELLEEKSLVRFTGIPPPPRHRRGTLRPVPAPASG